MRGTTATTDGHEHKWDAVRYDDKAFGFTDVISEHRHEISFPLKNSFAAGAKLITSEVDGHVHNVIIPDELLTATSFGCDEEEFKVKIAETESPYGPGDDGDEEDEKKIAKRKIDEDGLPMTGRKNFQGMTDKPWDGNKSRFTIAQLRKSVPAAMRKWGDSQPKGPDGEPSKKNYKLPYKEPNGTINVNGVRNALARAKQVKGPPSSAVNSAIKELQGVLERAKAKGFEDKHNFSMLTERHGVTVTVPGERLFSVGTWNGIDVEQEWINKIASNYQVLRLSFEPPIKAGHNEVDHANLMGELAAGWVHNVRVEGGFLVGDLEFPTKVYENYLKTRSLRYKSAEIVSNFTRNGIEYGPVMVGLALLGANYPAVNQLGAVALPFAEKKFDVRVINYDSGGESEMTEQEKKDLDAKIVKFNADKAKLDADKAALEADKAKFDEDKAEADKTKDADAKAKFADEKAEIEKRVVAAEARATHFAAKLRVQEAESFRDGLKAEGKLVPAQEEDFVNLFLTLSPDVKISFGEGKPDKSQVDMFKALFAGLKPQVVLDSQVALSGTLAADVPTPEMKTAELPADFPNRKKFMEIIKKQGLRVSGGDVMAKAAEIKAANKDMTEETSLSLAFAQIHDKK